MSIFCLPESASLLWKLYFSFPLIYTRYFPHNLKGSEQPQSTSPRHKLRPRRQEELWFTCNPVTHISTALSSMDQGQALSPVSGFSFWPPESPHLPRLLPLQGLERSRGTGCMLSASLGQVGARGSRGSGSSGMRGRGPAYSPQGEPFPGPNPSSSCN